MSDLISREAVLKLFATHDGNYLYEAIRDMPSAHPDITDEQAIVHLQASGWMQSHDKQMYEMGLKERLADDSDSYDALLPAAQPERKKGKWTDDNACPFCCFQPWYERDIHTLSYCPNCGADMRGEQDG